MSKEKYIINIPIPSYYTSVDAINRYNKHGIIKAGEYFVYNKVTGAVNVTTVANVPGVWINTEDNDSNKNLNNSTKTIDSIVTPSNTNTTSGYKSPDDRDSATTKRKVSSSGAKVFTSCYIKNLITGTKVSFEVPGVVGDLSESVGASFDGTSIRGRSNQIQGYESTGPRSVSINLELHDEYCEEGLAKTIAYIKGLVYPAYTNYVESPACYVRVTKAVKGIFVVGNVSVSYKPPIRDNMYLCADISIDLTEAGDAMSVTDIESGGGTAWG